MTKLVLCDLPNTLYDSRHRTTDNAIFLTNIEEDRLNQTAYRLIKDLQSLNYSIIFTHYCLTRLADTVEDRLHKDFSSAKLYTNFAIESVYNNQTLKQHIIQQFASTHSYFDYVIDNDRSMSAFYHKHNINNIKVPL